MHERFKPLIDWHVGMGSQSSQMAQAKPAAVAAIVFPIQNQDHVLLVKRNEYEGAHSGQMAFPGGKKDLNDPDLSHTVRREVEEEVGISLNIKDLVPYEPHWVIVSNFLVSPFYVALDKKPEWRIDKREINRIFEIPVSFFQDDSALKAHQLNILGEAFWAPYFEYEGERIWGATAMMLYQMLIKNPFEPRND